MLTMLAIYAGCMSLPEIAKSGAKIRENHVKCNSLTKKSTFQALVADDPDFYFDIPTKSHNFVI